MVAEGALVVATRVLVVATAIDVIAAGVLVATEILGCAANVLGISEDVSVASACVLAVSVEFKDSKADALLVDYSTNLVTSSTTSGLSALDRG